MRRQLLLSHIWQPFAHPPRLVGLLTLPMLYPDRAVDELNRAGKLPGIPGVYLGTNINNRDLDDLLFEPIWARIEEMDLPVFLHPIQTVGGERLRPFYLSKCGGRRAVEKDAGFPLFPQPRRLLDGFQAVWGKIIVVDESK